VYSIIEDKLEKQTSQEFIVPEGAQFGKVEDNETVHGSEQKFFVADDAVAGDETKKLEADGSQREFFAKDDALYDELVEDG
jgi:hypothetical protein